jgi:hypothetical protein
LKPLDPTLVREIQWLIGSRSETSDRADLDRSLGPSNVTIAPYDVSCVIPTEAQHVFKGLGYLLCAIRYALHEYFPIGWMAELMSKGHPVHHEFTEFQASLCDHWTQQSMGWYPTFVEDEDWDKNWDCLDTYHSKYWMPLGYVLVTEQVEWLKRRRNLLKERATNWDMGRWARSTALALRDIR